MTANSYPFKVSFQTFEGIKTVTTYAETKYHAVEKVIAFEQIQRKDIKKVTIKKY